MDWGAPFQWLIDQFKTLLHELGLDIWDGLLSVVDFVVNMLPANFGASWPTVMSLPADLLGLLGALGIWQAFGILGSAYLLRIPIGLILR